MVFLAACGKEAPACPAGMATMETRARGLRVLLERVPEGARVIGRVPAGAARVCFGRVPVSAVTPDGTVLLEASLGDAEAAARLGHLLLHVIEGPPMPALVPAAPALSGAECGAAVRRALVAEAGALALELGLRRALGVTAPALRYEFEQDFWRAPPEAREGVILAYLESHPGGGPGIDALAESYRRRCAGR